MSMLNVRLHACSVCLDMLSVMFCLFVVCFVPAAIVNVRFCLFLFLSWFVLASVPYMALYVTMHALTLVFYDTYHRTRTLHVHYIYFVVVVSFTRMPHRISWIGPRTLHNTPKRTTIAELSTLNAHDVVVSTESLFLSSCALS